MIRIDQGGEFENKKSSNLYNNNEITHNFTFHRASTQNGVVERENRTLQKSA